MSQVGRIGRMARTVFRARSDPTSRRERRLREVHDRIVRDAMDQFAARGAESVKVDEICDAADIAQRNCR